MPAKGTAKRAAKKVSKKATKKLTKNPVRKGTLGKFVRIVGYGTFLTRRTFERYKNVGLCKVTGFRRVHPPRSSYPFILPASDKDGFWALVFEVPCEELPGFDAYEGVPDLYERKTISVSLKSQAVIPADIYVPSEKAVQDFKLSTINDPSDRWRELIKEKLPDLLVQYPELAERVN
ncbi:MAG: hypothetical protein RBG13Loki_1910 [Promethearchaeota archaeon CR_4]|nr:MAG: hypothetical protein RBG13Loki_1910 [Candidatus Lokiarchaeota archaeon CR_4]